jgi:hypothetical protein
MIIDIRDDVPDFLQYVQLRVNKQVESLKKRPTPALISRIDFGFEFGQANWVALVFDTRENVEPDGE